MQIFETDFYKKNCIEWLLLELILIEVYFVYIM